jgi:hypothetical protein
MASQARSPTCALLLQIAPLTRCVFLHHSDAVTDAQAWEASLVTHLKDNIRVAAIVPYTYLPAPLTRCLLVKL